MSKSEIKRKRIINGFDPLSSRHMFLENTDEWMHCHEEQVCYMDFCTLHNRSDHPMRAFPQHWRIDRAIMERICTHGVGHPDPDEYRIRVGLDDGTHGCDGCCSGVSFEPHS